MSADNNEEKSNVDENIDGSPEHSQAFPGVSTDSPRPNDTSGNEEHETNDIKVEDAEARIEHQATQILRNFLYEPEYEMARKLAAGSKPPPDDDSDDEHGDNEHMFEVARQLRIIGENLDSQYKSDFRQIINAVHTEALGRRNIITFMWLMRKFIEILKSSVNFPINLIKTSFQTLIAVWLNPGVLPEGGEGDVPNSANLVIQDLEERAIKTYLKALMNETETARHIRIMVIGMFAAGKTSLVQNLLNLDKAEVESTDGIDIHINECFINGKDEWLFQESNFAEITDYKFRVAAMMNRSKTSEISASSSDAEVLYQQVKDSHVGKEVKKQTSVSVEDISKTKTVLETFRESDPILGSFLKDLYEAWIISETKSKDEKSEIKSSTQATVSVWDFAGQDVYYSTHHFFMNPASIYLLTMDISIPLESKLSDSGTQSHFTHFHVGATYLDAFKFWLNSVHTYSTKYGEKTPTVILVGTHIDQVDGTLKEKLQKGEDYFDEALKSFINSPVLQHVHPKKFFVNNTNPEEDFNFLRREILELARQHKSWNQVVPARWILLERSLEQFRSEGKEMVTVTELMERDAENEYPIGSQSEMKEFLRFHHSLGNLLYFDTESLENHVILSPQWIVDAFRCFVTSFPKKDPAHLKLWDDYEKQAKLSPALLHSIIDNNRCLADYRDEVVNYMEHLDIMAQPTIYVTETEKADKAVKDQENENTGRKSVFDSAEDDDQTSLKRPVSDSANTSKCIEEGDVVEKEKLDFHIVPSVLSARPSEDFIKQIVNPGQALKTSVLCYVFSGEFLPPAIFHRLVAVCINWWPVSTRQRQFLLFRGLAVFSLTPTMELAIWMHDYVIFCRVVFYAIMGKGIPSDLCQEARAFIKNTLQELLGIYRDKWTVLPFEEYIHCDQAEDPLLGLITVEDLISKGEVVCKAHSVVHVINSGEALAHWYGDFADGNKQEKGGRSTEVDLTKIPTEKELSRLSAKIGHEYFRLGLELRVPSAAIQHCQLNHNFDMASIIFCVLQKWKEMNGQSATLDKLKSSMEIVDCDMEGFYEVFAMKPQP